MSSNKENEDLFPVSLQEAMISIRAFKIKTNCLFLTQIMTGGKHTYKQTP